MNTAEFLVTVTVSATFMFNPGWQAFTTAALGLLISGVLAAPLGAMFVKRVNPGKLLIIVGALLTATSGYALSQAINVSRR